MQVILTFDVGTTAMKCCAFDRDLRLLDNVTTEYTLNTPAEHIVEVDPSVYWRGLCASTAALFSGRLDPSDVAAVGITTQGETTVVLDEAGSPIMPAIVWLDDRAAAEAEQLTALIGSDRLYRSTGLPALNGAVPLAKLKWIMDRPALKKRAHKILLLEDYLIYKLTGRFVTEHSLICSTGYYDIMTRRYHDDFLRFANADVRLLPEVFPCGCVAGGITEKASGETGLPSCTPVVCTAMDQTASAVGAGNVTPGTVSETTGTCLTVAATTKAPDFDSKVPLQYYTHYDDSYLALAYNPTAAIVMKWFKDQFITDSDGFRSSGLNPYTYMSQLAAPIPPGSDGLFLIPHFAGKKIPQECPDMRGCFMGLGLGTTKGHFVRAIMEGVAYMLREDLDVFRTAGISVSQIRSLGGGSRDKLWCAIKASVTGCELLTCDNEESTSLGAGILTAQAIGWGSVPALCAKAVTLKASYTPGSAEKAAYESLYRDYLRLDAMAVGFYSKTPSAFAGIDAKQ